MNRDRIEFIARALENTAENVNGLKFGVDPNLLSETNNSAPINKVSFTDYVRGKTRQWFPRR